MDAYTHLPGTNIVSNTEKLLSREPLFNSEGSTTIMSKNLGVGDANDGGTYLGGTWQASGQQVGSCATTKHPPTKAIDKRSNFLNGFGRFSVASQLVHFLGNK
jgi:hypothetical protein